METILYATKIGAPEYMEEIITTNPEKIDEAKAWAKENGFDRFRIAKIDLGEKPDFIGTINK